MPKKEGITLCVEDHGVGISKENRDKIFERFYRVNGPGYQTFPGIGLGLYISNEIVKGREAVYGFKVKRRRGQYFVLNYLTITG